ncbi:hypothetical protein QJS04_geneDACA023640 [Acorus gramineus]|uniref:Uncharacterized protein n=1 Tax=Acorus gramineus TaxID=55184 RepID=A0AAV9AA81_ACOGR|nr:hypothetical protein QJS04_geneDACA023640 [Acorus gramineus]
MEQTEKSNIESPSLKSPEIQAFFELVDREAQRFQMINERKERETCNKALVKSSITWKPSFEMEDFIEKDLSGPSTVVVGAQEGKHQRGLKRPAGTSVNLAPLVCDDERLRKTCSIHRGVCDSKDVDDPVIDVSLWRLWFNN